MAETNQSLLTPKQVQERLGICAETLNRWRRKRVLVAVRINSRVFRYRESDIEKLEYVP